ncbi:MAG: GHKL domain-containing protein [Bacillota bacterium]|nr:GHKL domain-containing protein [Bacillota bacterium]
MILVLIFIILIILKLYISEVIKNRKNTKDEDFEKKYCDILSENMELKLELEAVKKEYDKQTGMAAEIKSLNKKARTLKHDMKNHIMVITSYLNDGEYDEAKNYLSKIADNLNKIYTYIETGNSLLNYIINTKLQLAMEKGIDVKAEIENLSFDQIGSVDFSALLNNLLDNAIEASLNTNNKEMVVNILRKRGYDTILVKNKIGKSVLKDNPNLISTKKNKEEHGYGLKHIKALVDKYEGMLDIYEEDNFFCVYVVYPH